MNSKVTTCQQSLHLPKLHYSLFLLLKQIGVLQQVNEQLWQFREKLCKKASDTVAGKKGMQLII